MACVRPFGITVSLNIQTVHLKISGYTTRYSHHYRHHHGDDEYTGLLHVDLLTALIHAIISYNYCTHC
jgi:argonaute-like protein implicated in RNA metabolism and viral defense